MVAGVHPFRVRDRPYDQGQRQALSMVAERGEDEAGLLPRPTIRTPKEKAAEAAQKSTAGSSCCPFAPRLQRTARRPVRRW